MSNPLHVITILDFLSLYLYIYPGVIIANIVIYTEKRMASKKAGSRTTFCSIVKWLEYEDESFFGGLDALCTIHNLKPKPNSSGITFLYPEDEKYRQSIIKAQLGNSDVQLEAEKKVKALVLHMNLPNAGAFLQNQKDIPNALGNKVKVIKTSGNSVELEGGVTIVPDPNFAPRSDRENMSVWRITKGEMSLTGEKATYENSKKSKKGAKDGKDITGGRGPIVNRAQFAKFIEEKFRQYAMRGTLVKCDPYLESLVSLYSWLKLSAQAGDQAADELLYSILASTGPTWRVEFYNVFQPYKDRGHLVPDTVFSQWQEETQGYCFVSDLASTYLKMFDLLDKCETKRPELCFSKEGRTKIREAQDKVRGKLFAEAGLTSLAGNMVAAYRELIENNTINGVGPVYPEYLHKYYRENPDVKFIQEEIHLLIGTAFNDIESESSSVEEYVRSHLELCNVLTVRLNFRGSVRDCTLFNADHHLTGIFWYSGPFALLRSTNFLFIGSPEGDTSRTAMDTNIEPNSVTVMDTASHEWFLIRQKVALYDAATKGKQNAAARALEAAALLSKVFA